MLGERRSTTVSPFYLASSDRRLSLLLFARQSVPQYPPLLYHAGEHPGTPIKKRASLHLAQQQVDAQLSKLDQQKKILEGNIEKKSSTKKKSKCELSTLLIESKRTRWEVYCFLGAASGNMVRSYKIHSRLDPADVIDAAWSPG